MFTKDQLEQLRALLQAERKETRKLVREETELEAEKTRKEVFEARLYLLDQIQGTKDGVKDLEVGVIRLEQGQEEQKREQQTQGKTLKYVKTKLNKVARDVDVIGRSYNQEIVASKRKIARIEEVIGILPQSH